MNTMDSDKWVARQPYLFGYGACISAVSPLASCYQLLKLNPQVKVPLKEMAVLSARIFPQQTLLKAAQMNASTPVKEHLNPWMAFAFVGFLQGGVYGQANIHFAKNLGIGKKLSLKGMFRGGGFAAGRDTLSQGIPFMLSDTLLKHVIDPLYPTEPGHPLSTVKQYGSVIACSVAATLASQGMHNCQITMQANQELTHFTTLPAVLEKHGLSFLWKGASARVSLLLVVNILNETLLKAAWRGEEAAAAGEE